MKYGKPPLIGRDEHATECREQNRTPKHRGMAKRGPSAGMPLRHSTFSSKYMTKEDALALVDAADFAEKVLHLPLTAHMTVTWQSAPNFNKNSPASYTQVHQRLMRALREFLGREGIELVFDCARENIVGQGGHSHYRIHLPPDDWARRRVRLTKYVSERMGFRDSRALLITPYRLPNAGETTSHQRRGQMQYQLGSMDPNVELPTFGPLLAFLGLKHKPGAALPNGCKRVVWSENIGESARKRKGWKDRRTMLELENYLSDDSVPTVGGLCPSVAPPMIGGASSAY